MTIYQNNNQGLAINQWIEYLQKDIREDHLQFIVNIYFFPNHECSMTEYNNKYGVNNSKHIMVALAKDIIKKYENKNAEIYCYYRGGRVAYWSVLFRCYEKKIKGKKYDIWMLREELVFALEKYLNNFQSKDIFEYQKEYVEQESFFLEGNVSYQISKKIERSSQAVNFFKKRKRKVCDVCQNSTIIDGIDISEVHHKITLVEKSFLEEYQVYPMKDFALLCPNCHTYIHKMAQKRQDLNYLSDFSLYKNMKN